MKSYSGEFWARLHVIDGSYVQTKFWANELEPMEAGRRSTDEWAEESVTSHFGPDIFGIPTEGCFQTLVHARISGGFDYLGEYDEDIEVLSVRFEPMPDSYASAFTEPTEEQS